MTSARTIKKSLGKLKKSAPVPHKFSAEEKAQNEAYSKMSMAAQQQAADLFEAHRNLDTPDLVDYIEAHAPSALAVAMVIRLAEASDDPDKPRRLAKQKAEKLWGETKKKALQAWAENKITGKYKSKDKFAEKFSEVLAQSGKKVEMGTIYKWLPTKKK